VVDLVGQYAGLGFDEFVLNCGILVGPAQRRRDAIARIRSEVLGQLG
jgi:hypothetical protein